MKMYDPQMHTAEHILNQTMVRMFGIDRAFSSHLERKKSKCDYIFDRPLTPDEEVAIEKHVNEQLKLHLPVEEHWLTKEEAEKTYNLKKLPEEADEKIRIVTIGNYDACPCIGAHVENTVEVGEFVFGSSSCEDGVLRIRFKLNRPQTDN
jgi:misacylated tRNA(Ala) deacylase